MQANEFEKQVSSKMDELSFTPSAPVWDNIEKEIRQKNKRRRIILWLPICTLLLTGGIWWLTTFNKTHSTGINSNTIENSASTNKSIYKKHNTEATTIIHTKTSAEAIKVQTSAEGIKVQTSLDRVQMQASNTSPINKKSSGKKELIQITKNSMNYPGSGHYASSRSKTIKSSIPHKNNEGELSSNPDNLAEQITSEPFLTEAPLNKEKKDTVHHATTVITDSIKIDSSHKTDIKKQKKLDKLIVSATIKGGFSGLAQNTAISNGGLNYNATMVNANAQSAAPLPPTKPENGFSFGAGVQIRKSISKRLSILSGLQYNYMSASVDIGMRMRRDTIIASGFSSSVRVTEYYTKANTGNSYKNNYHFVSIPLQADIKLFNNIPLHLRPGFAVHQLIATNALIYNYASQLYYHDKKAFNKTQFSSSLGLLYQTSLKGNAVFIGPEINYMWTRLEKQNTAYQHLFSAGIKLTVDLTN